MNTKFMSDTRWKQRFNNYIKAFQTLVAAVELARSRELSELEQQGVIQSFELTHELAWNVLKDYLTEKGIVGLIGSKDATRSAFKNGLIEKGDDLQASISSELDDLLLPYTIDLSIFKELNHAKLSDHIERVGIVFYERSNDSKTRI